MIIDLASHSFITASSHGQPSKASDMTIADYLKINNLS